MRYLSRFCAALLVYPVEVITNRVLFAPVFFSTAEITLLSALSILTYPAAPSGFQDRKDFCNFLREELLTNNRLFHLLRFAFH